MGQMQRQKRIHKEIAGKAPAVVFWRLHPVQRIGLAWPLIERIIKNARSDTSQVEGEVIRIQATDAPRKDISGFIVELNLAARASGHKIKYHGDAT